MFNEYVQRIEEKINEIREIMEKENKAVVITMSTNVNDLNVLFNTVRGNALLTNLSDDELSSLQEQLYSCELKKYDEIVYFAACKNMKYRVIILMNMVLAFTNIDDGLSVLKTSLVAMLFMLLYREKQIDYTNLLNEVIEYVKTGFRENYKTLIITETQRQESIDSVNKLLETIGSKASVLSLPLHTYFYLDKEVYKKGIYFVLDNGTPSVILYPIDYDKFKEIVDTDLKTMLSLLQQYHDSPAWTMLGYLKKIMGD